jgi:hypothetical protein
MKRIITIFYIVFLFVFINYNLFSEGSQESSDDLYYSHYFNFNADKDYIIFDIYGSVLLKPFYSPSIHSIHGEILKEEQIEFYYVLELYEPITFSSKLKTITVEEIQLIFDNKDLIKNIDLEWVGHIIGGKLYFSDNDSYHTPLILVVTRISVNG